MSSLYYQQESAALYYAVFGKNIPAEQYDAYGNQLQNGSLTLVSLSDTLLSSKSALTLFSGKTQEQTIAQIYTNVYGVAPDSATLSTLIATGSIANATATVVDGLLHYTGFDSTTLAQQNAFESTLDTALFPATSNSALAGAADVQALFYVLGKTQGASGTNYWGSVLASGSKTLEQVANTFVQSTSNVVSLSDSDFINFVYQNTYGRSASSIEAKLYLSELSAGASRGQIITEVIDGIRGSVTTADAAAQTQFLAATQVYQQGTLPGLSYQEQIAAFYLALPQRGVDASGLDTWSKQLTYINSNAVVTKLINSAEFQAKGTSLTGNDFIQHVFTAVHGIVATAAQLATYGALGSDKAAITLAIINDLRTSTATDNTTVSQQHAFEADIGSSLLYKTAATLSSSSASGNATGTVNTGSSHVLSNAETAVLQNVVLNAGTASSVNLKFADQLANLTINGSRAATVNLSDNGINAGVNVAVNNANVILNAGSGDDHVTLTNTAAINTGIGQFNLGLGNDTLSWAGNAATGGANSVSTSLKADGGAGSNVLSANLITKSVLTTENGLNVRASTISSNVYNFSNFDKIDLAGYIGKSASTLSSTSLFGTVTTSQVITGNHTFDYGLLTRGATVEGTSAGSVTQTTLPALSYLTQTVGNKGFVLSGFADAVSVINVAGPGLLNGVNPTQLEVTGNATAASGLAFTFVQDADSKFNINFTAHSDTDVNAGSVSLTSSSSSSLLGTALSTVNIASGGTGNFTNLLTLNGGNQVTTLNLTGDHLLDLNIGSALSNVRTIDASGNTAGVNITADIAGTGTSSLATFINGFPFGSVLTETFGLNGRSINITGTTAADTFTVKDNTTITGNGGNDKFEIVSSGSTSSVKIADYNYASNSILDLTSNLLISDDKTGTKVADYGSKTASLITQPSTNVVGDLLASLLGLDKLSAKVGISSVDNTNFLVIDQNNNGKFDSADTVVTLVGGTHDALVQNLYYA